MQYMSQDLASIFVWWITFFGLGAIFSPISWLVFRKFSDSGWTLSKILGLAAVSFTFFLLSTAKILPFTQISVFLVIAVFFLLNLFIFVKFKEKIINGLLSKKAPILIGEVLFVLGLFAWSWVRAHQPDIRGLEKFMDFGFINSILRGRFLPPADIWYSGSPVNYYWFGHLSVAVLTKLTGIASDISYNLMLGAILGLALSAAFSIVSSLFEKFGKKAAVAGILSALLLTMGGNFHTPYYALTDGYEKYWYPDATRFIGYNPDTNDKTIHEFPSYSFIVSDLHAHVLDFPFVLLFLALLLAQVKFSDKKRTLTLPLVFMGGLLGIMFSTSTWDYGIYLIVAAIAFVLLNLSDGKINLKVFWHSARPTILIGVLGLLTALPFIFNFHSIAQGINLVNAKTPLWQLLILWGFPLLVSAIFIFHLAKSRKILPTEIFVLGLITAAWMLIAMPEIFYVKDIYSGSHQRANTMFKLTYQAFVMFYLSSGYIIVTFLSAIKRLHYKFFASLVTSAVISSLLIYPYFGIKSYYGELKDYKGLGGIKWLSSSYPEEYQAVLWLNQNVKGQPVILEAPGDSYTDNNVISSYTGLSTVSGWYVHEWLWRGSPEIPQKRVADITTIYLSKNSWEAKSLLNKYNVSYVIVGSFEKEKFPTLDETKFALLGKEVFVSGGTRIYKVTP